MPLPEPHRGSILVALCLLKSRPSGTPSLTCPVSPHCACGLYGVIEIQPLRGCPDATSSSPVKTILPCAATGASERLNLDNTVQAAQPRSAVIHVNLQHASRRDAISAHDRKKYKHTPLRHSTSQDYLLLIAYSASCTLFVKNYFFRQ